MSPLDNQVDVVFFCVLGDLINRSTDSRGAMNLHLRGPFRTRLLGKLLLRLHAQFRQPIGKRNEGLAAPRRDGVVILQHVEQMHFRVELLRQFAGVADRVLAEFTEIGGAKNAVQLEREGFLSTTSHKRLRLKPDAPAKFLANQASLAHQASTARENVDYRCGVSATKLARVHLWHSMHCMVASNQARAEPSSLPSLAFLASRLAVL